MAYRTVSVLRTGCELHPDRTFYKAPNLKVDVSGFWKKLPVGEVGTDKQGRPIHGRTWVEKVLTWTEADDDPRPLLATHYPPKVAKGGDVKEKGDSGFIYVMRSAAHDKDIFKIGLTRRSTDIRSAELSRVTGSPDTFLVAQEWDVSNCTKAEAMIHKALSAFRLSPRREFFKAPYKEIVKAIETILEELEK